MESTILNPLTSLPYSPSRSSSPTWTLLHATSFLFLLSPSHWPTNMPKSLRPTKTHPPSTPFAFSVTSFAFPFQSLPNFQSGLSYMPSPSSPLPPPPQSTAMWFSPCLGHQDITPLNPMEAPLSWLPPTSLVVPSQSPLGALVISSTFKHWYSFASFLLPFLFALVGSCILVISFLYSDSQITVPQLDSSPELNQTPVSNYLISPPVCPQSPKAQHVLIDGFIFSPKLLLVYFLSRLVAS